MDEEETEVRKVPGYRIRLPSRRYRLLTGTVSQELVKNGKVALVHFRSEWSEGQAIWMPIGVRELPDGSLDVYTNHEYVEAYEIE